ncbi:DUF1694 domain-containing protein [Haliovirga abyssi]|uniref:DUF1694 domain-containing protein n=1 Tax=Haliovirga abyssi TaxID=2996794 RepID=A0AAU9DXI5_9FUSO|nr:DUF1694 domain-containing protein [Haliovirga abyssi]BDU51166.1 hypothetical protein HLVA_17350 [Haliovirga abyssi]
MDKREMIDEIEKNRMSFLKVQSEKNIFLGEYKERIIAALTKDQIIEDDVYPEIIAAINETRAYILKMSRDLPLKKLKPYIAEAEKIKLKYQLVDGLAYSGNIGLIIAAKEALKETKENVVIRDMDQDFIDAGLGEKFSKNKGKKICDECYEQVVKKLPQYKDEFKKMTIFDKILGIKCAVCKK